MIGPIEPNATTSVSADGRWLDEYAAYTAWAMRVIAQDRREVLALIPREDTP